ncbi:MAG: M1 family metallopeptidase [Polyangia bacterium]
MGRPDPHSYADTRHVELADLTWSARVDFAARRIEATATLRHAGKVDALPHVDLDTRGLEILDVQSGERALEWKLGDDDLVLGRRLRITLADPTRDGELTIRYRTGVDASALQWLTPEQTAGGVHPFLFTQCQAVHARSLVPMQDTPRVRIRYRAELRVPAALRGLMAARAVGRRVDGDTAIESWEMPEPIPPYLFAFAVGELVSAELGPRSRVWAEPSMLPKATYEFAEVDHMLVAAEQLFGSYDWERFDLLVMPPSFPYGGMENPRLTFVTPTLLAGDRSLTSVVAHELAHSWTGNLVSGASAEHFWINEGMTVWAERRIVEALWGRERAELDAALGRRELERTLVSFASRPELTSLRTSLDGIDPDEVFSVVPYEKGYLLARALEEDVGRERFDAYVASYVRTFRFRSITTDDFVALVRAELPGALERVHAALYLEAPGMPPNTPVARSTRLDALVALGDAIPDTPTAAQLSATEWQLWLDALPVPYPRAAELDAIYGLYRSGNFEIRAGFVEVALAAGLPDALDEADRLLGEVGRMKYLKPVYKALKLSDAGRARAVFARHRGKYHPIALQVVSGLLA